MTEDTQLPEEEETTAPAEEPAEETTEAEDTPEEPKEDLAAPPLRIAHPLWRGWWLAVVLLGCFVLLGQRPSPGAAWLKQPMRAFAGAILLGGSLGALPGFLRGRKVDKPAWKRCLLAVLSGLVWGVLA